MVLYIASDAPLELIPWDEARPSFHVSSLTPDDDLVRRQFGVSHACYAGSHEGCGCGFQLGEYPGFDDEEAPQKRDSLTALAQYIDTRLALGRTIELFACWAGREAKPPERMRSLSTAELRAEQFFFHDGEHVTVHAPPNPALLPTPQSPRG